MDHRHIIKIEDNGQLLALVIRSEFSEDGATFFTPQEFSQQVGFLKYPKGHVIDAHSHCSVPREVTVTQEVLVVRKGRMRADFYSTEQEYVTSLELSTNDLLLLISGGHGFEVIEPLELLEIKQGPYLGDHEDKIRFQTSVHDSAADTKIT